jgi:hypothetical protein
MSRTVAVFLNRKLISCDTILPLLLELKIRAPEVKVEIWIPDHETFAAIHRNLVLADVARNVGRMYVLSGRGLTRTRRIQHRLLIGFRFVKLGIKALFGQAAFIHFKALSNWPLKAFYYAAPSDTFLAENDSYGFTELMSKVTFLIDEVPLAKRVPPAGHLIAFSDQWHLLKHPAMVEVPRRMFGPTRLRGPWLEFIKSKADHYLGLELARAGMGTAEEFLLVMLGFFGPLAYVRDPDVVEELLQETLEELAAVAGGRPILIKPHVITDMKKLQRIIDSLPSARILVSHLHPMVLATRARLVVANYYTTTLMDCHWMGVPTIEYSHYNDRALQLTAGGSMRPEVVDYFINHDRELLRETLEKLLIQPVRAMPMGKKSDQSDIFNLLAGRN